MPNSDVATGAHDKTKVRFVGAVAGVASGLTKVAMGHGFDTIKVRMQCAPLGMYTGALDCLLKTVRNESVLALYKGASPPAVGWAAIDSVLLGSLHNYRLILARHGMVESSPHSSKPRLTLLGHGVAGLMAGPTSALVSHPVDLLKAKLQLQMERSVADRQFKGPIDAAKQTIRTRGVLGLWGGFASSVLFRANFFFMFGSVELLMRLFSRLDGTSSQMGTGLKTFFAGGLGSFSFWLFAMPFDNIKNRILIHPLDQPRPPIPAVARSVYKAYGWRGFYRGFVPCSIRAFPVNSCAYFVYEALMRALGAEPTRA